MKPEKTFGKKKKSVSNGFDYDDEFNQSNDFAETEVVYSQTFTPSRTPGPSSKFPEGTMVKHKLYGEGKILETRGVGKEEKIVILFRDGARKKFMAKFAPIEKI